MKWLWTTFLHQPLYNALVFFVAVIPGQSFAISIIILTLLVRLILSPLSKRATLTQIKQKEIQPEVENIRKNIKDQKEQGQALLDLYKKHKLNPLSGFFLILIQLPIILALYHVFRDGIAYAPDIIYSFVQYPETINLTIFNSINLGEQSLILALFAGITQYIQIKFSPSFSQSRKKEPQTQQEKTMQNIQGKMVFTMPVLITVFAYFLPSAISLYWMTSNIYTLIQEILIRKNLKKDSEEQGE